MPAPDEDSFMTKDDFYFLSAMGLLEEKPSKPEFVGDQESDEPGSATWAWKHRRWKKRKRLGGSDTGGILIPWWASHSSTDWAARLRLNDPGVVDPVASVHSMNRWQRGTQYTSKAIDPQLKYC